MLQAMALSPLQPMMVKTKKTPKKDKWWIISCLISKMDSCIEDYLTVVLRYQTLIYWLDKYPDNGPVALKKLLGFKSKFGTFWQLWINFDQLFANIKTIIQPPIFNFRPILGLFDPLKAHSNYFWATLSKIWSDFSNFERIENQIILHFMPMAHNFCF